MKSKTGNIVKDIVNSEIHYIRELRELCRRGLTSIEFETHYQDLVDPKTAGVQNILERTTRYLCKTEKTKVLSSSSNTQTIAFRKRRRSCGSFTMDDVILYIHEFEHLMGASKLTLPPFTRDRLINTWKELLHCYVETKRLDRLNDYIVVFGIGVSTITNDDWKLFVTVKSRSTSIEDADSRWTILEHNEYLFT